MLLLKLWDRPWIHQRYEVEPRNIGTVVKVTDTQVHIEMDYGRKGGPRNLVCKFRRFDSVRFCAGHQIDGAKQKTIYRLATSEEVETYESAITQEIHERSQIAARKLGNEFRLVKLRALFPEKANLYIDIETTADQSIKGYGLHIQGLSISDLKELQLRTSGAGVSFNFPEVQS